MVLTWWIIGILAFVVFLALFKSQDLVFVFSFVKKNFFPLVLLLVILFFCFSFYNVYKSHDIKLNSFEGVVSGGKVYMLWLKSVFVNVGKITGYAVNQDWVLANSTNVTKK